MNSGKQVAVLSAILYCRCENELFQKIREKKTVCWINVGIVDTLIVVGN